MVDQRWSIDVITVAINLTGGQNALGDQQADQALQFATDPLSGTIAVWPWPPRRPVIIAPVAIVAGNAAAAIAVIGIVVAVAHRLIIRVTGRQQGDINGLHALFTGLDLKLDPFAGLEVAKAFHVDVVLMDKDIFTAVIGYQEAVAPAAIETSDNSSRQWTHPSQSCGGRCDRCTTSVMTFHTVPA